MDMKKKMKEVEKEFDKAVTLENLQGLFSQKTNPDSIKKIKEYSNLLIKHKNENELMELLNKNFKKENIKDHNPHLLTVVSSVYSGISHEIGLEYNLRVIENLKEVPNGIVSNLFRNARNLHMRLYEQKAKQTILSEMVNGISHEFGQPITNIKFLIQYNQKILQDTVTKKEVLKIFSSILEDIERLSHLVKTMVLEFPIQKEKIFLFHFIRQN